MACWGMVLGLRGGEVSKGRGEVLLPDLQLPLSITVRTLLLVGMADRYKQVIVLGLCVG